MEISKNYTMFATSIYYLFSKLMNNNYNYLFSKLMNIKFCFICKKGQLGNGFTVLEMKVYIYLLDNYYPFPHFGCNHNVWHHFVGDIS